MRVHRPIGVDGPLPAIVWMHGGGLVAGTYLLDDGRFDRWCPKFGVVGVAVDYGLAPGAAVPGPDRGLLRRAALDPRARRRARHRARPRRHRRLQRRRQPGRRPRAAGPRSRRAAGGVPGARLPDARRPDDHDVELRGTCRSGRRCRTTSAGTRTSRAAAARDDVPIYAAPARAEDLAGLPPTFICVGALDGFLDEDVDYANRLLRAGVPVELHVYPGAPHGFDLMMVNTDIARRCRTHLDEWLGARLA